MMSSLFLISRDSSPAGIGTFPEGGCRDIKGPDPPSLLIRNICHSLMCEFMNYNYHCPTKIVNY